MEAASKASRQSWSNRTLGARQPPTSSSSFLSTSLVSDYRAIFQLAFVIRLQSSCVAKIRRYTSPATRPDEIMMAPPAAATSRREINGTAPAWRKVGQLVCKLVTPGRVEAVCMADSHLICEYTIFFIFIFADRIPFLWTARKVRQLQE